jgi:hypothetical protein
MHRVAKALTRKERNWPILSRIDERLLPLPDRPCQAYHPQWFAFAASALQVTSYSNSTPVAVARRTAGRSCQACLSTKLPPFFSDGELELALPTLAGPRRTIQYIGPLPEQPRLRSAARFLDTLSSHTRKQDISTPTAATCCLTHPNINNRSHNQTRNLAAKPWAAVNVH